MKAIKAVWTSLAVQNALFPGTADEAANHLLSIHPNTFPNGIGRPGTAQIAHWHWPLIGEKFCLWAIDKNVLLTPPLLSREKRGSIPKDSNPDESCDTSPKDDAGHNQSFPRAAHLTNRNKPIDAPEWLITALHRLLPAQPPEEWPEGHPRLLCKRSNRPEFKSLLEFLALETPADLRAHARIENISKHWDLIRFSKPVAAAWRKKHLGLHSSFRRNCLIPDYPGLREKWESLISLSPPASKELNAFGLNLEKPFDAEHAIAARVAAKLKSEVITPLKPEASNRVLVNIILLPSIWRFLLDSKCVFQSKDFPDTFGFSKSDLKRAVIYQLQELATDARRLQQYQFLDSVKESGFSIDWDTIPSPEAYLRIDPENIDLNNRPEGLGATT